MALDLIPPFDKMVALLTALPGMQAVYEGVPNTLAKGVNAYIAATAQNPKDVASSGLIENEATFFVGLSYAIRDSAEGTAERQLMVALTALIKALIIARRTKLDGTCDTLSWDFSLANDPAYQVSAAREFRIFPVLVRIIQRETLAFQ